MVFAQLGEQLSEFLQPIADGFGSFGTPAAIVHWGHPLMMGIVVFVMGSFVGLTGWRIRTLGSGEAALKSRKDHKVMAPLMATFIALGYTGGLLSLVMQGEPILDSPHFWTGSVVLILLAANGAIAALGFSKGNPGFRSAHAYLGSAALCVMFLHALLGLKLGLSI
ncbi:MAG: DUF4079 domain-containing protein [Elainellaceae cyanobacterium]